MTLEILATLLLMGLVAFGCRATGFWAMRHVTPSPRVKAALAAVPIAVMAAILAPASMQAGWPELSALATAAVAMALTGKDLLAVGLALAVLAVARSLTL